MNFLNASWRLPATVSIGARPIAALQDAPPGLAVTARGMERRHPLALLIRGDLQNAPKHGKGVVARRQVARSRER